MFCGVSVDCSVFTDNYDACVVELTGYLIILRWFVHLQMVSPVSVLSRPNIEQLH